MSEPILQFEHFGFQYNAQAEPTLHDINLTVHKIVVDIDKPVFEIKIYPSETKALTNPHPGPDQDCDDRFPSLILMVGI